jgi:hypothetical protein
MVEILRYILNWYEALIFLDVLFMFSLSIKWIPCHPNKLMYGIMDSCDLPVHQLHDFQEHCSPKLDLVQFGGMKINLNWASW